MQATSSARPARRAARGRRRSWRPAPSGGARARGPAWPGRPRRGRAPPPAWTSAGISRREDAQRSPTEMTRGG